MTFLSRFTPHTYALLRIVTGLLFACHGSQKLFGFPGGKGGELPPLIVAAGAIEFFGGLMIAAGLLTGIAAFISSGTMAVAYFMAHAPQGFFPAVNKGELAVVYAFLFLYFAAHGSGIWSIDAAIGRDRSRAVNGEG